MIKILDDILKSVPKEWNIDDYVFVCSKDFECEINEYKNIKVYYHNWLEENTIHYMKNPYIDYSNIHIDITKQ
jgi:hypothetical protein